MEPGTKKSSNSWHQLPPLQIVVCYNGGNKLSSELVHELSIAIRGNRTDSNPYVATLSDLPIPLRCFGKAPSVDDVNPGRLLNGALHTMLVVFADDDMMYDCDWETWLTECREVLDQTEDQPHRASVICMHDSLLKSFTFLGSGSDSVELRSYDAVQELNDKLNVFGEFAERGAWISLYVMQRCRAQLLSAGPEPKDKGLEELQIFISHAKKDSLPLAHSVRSALQDKDFLPHWYDADNLRDVDDWQREIRNGAENSVVVVLRTEMYDTRPWCRQEFLWAEQCGVPIICVEARTKLMHKADRLVASRVPTVYIPDGNLFRILIPALKESLRILQLDRLRRDLESNHPGFIKACGVSQIPYSPGLKHLAHVAACLREKRSLPPGMKRDEKKRNLTRDYNVIFYADPPMTKELYDASKDFVEHRSGERTYMLTPTLLPFWDCEGDRALDGGLASYSLSESIRNKDDSVEHRKLKINISISEHEGDLSRLGLTIGDVNDFTVHVAQAIMANEGIVMLGHDWRNDGVMQRMATFAEEHQDIVLYEKERTGLIINCVFWGFPPAMSEREMQQLRGVLDIVPGAKPDDPLLKDYRYFPGVPGALETSERNPPSPKGLKGYAFALSLTLMRKQMTKDSFARVCLGGRDMDPNNPKDAPKGRTAGVVEEAYLSCVFHKPLYLSALLGGVTGQIIKAFLGDDSARIDFVLAEEVVTLYGDFTPNLEDPDYNGPLEAGALIAYFREYGIGRLSENNGLSIEENIQLFMAQTIDEVTAWVLKGLANLQKRGNNGDSSELS